MHSVLLTYRGLQVALETLQERSVVLFGGHGKRDIDGDLGFSEVATLCGPHEVITFGQSGEEIRAELESQRVQLLATCSKLSDAVRHAKSVVKRDPSIKNVLLSPGCASFDEFQGFEDRGHQFAALAEAQP